LYFHVFFALFFLKPLFPKKEEKAIPQRARTLTKSYFFSRFVEFVLSPVICIIVIFFDIYAICVFIIIGKFNHKEKIIMIVTLCDKIAFILELAQKVDYGRRRLTNGTQQRFYICWTYLGMNNLRYFELLQVNLSGCK
jgi:hypothetical protein